MACNLPISVLADDHPGDLYHQCRRRAAVEEEGCRRRHVGQVGADLSRPHLAELSPLGGPARQAVEIGGDAVASAIEVWVRSEEKRVPRKERGECLGIDPLEAGAPFCDDRRSDRTGFACHQPLPTSLANVSRKPMVRLNTNLSGVESGSRTK